MEYVNSGVPTGEGFTGEKALAIASVILTIVSTVLLIDLCISQKRHTNMQIAKFKLEEEKNKI